MNIIRKKLLEVRRLLTDDADVQRCVDDILAQLTSRDDQMKATNVQLGEGSTMQHCQIPQGCKVRVGKNCRIVGLFMNPGAQEVVIGDNCIIICSTFATDRVTVGSGSALFGAHFRCVSVSVGAGAFMARAGLNAHEYGFISVGPGAVMYRASLDMHGANNASRASIGARLTMAPYDTMKENPRSAVLDIFSRASHGGLNDWGYDLDFEVRYANLKLGDDALLCQPMTMIVESGTVSLGNNFRLVPFDGGDYHYWHDYSMCTVRYCRLSGGNNVTVCASQQNSKPGRYMRLSAFRPNSLYLGGCSTLVIRHNDRTPQRVEVPAGKMLVI